MKRIFQRYLATREIAIETVIDHLGKSDLLKAQSPTSIRQRRILLDTLDWRFASHGWRLELQEIPKTSKCELVLTDEKGVSFRGEYAGKPTTSSHPQPISIQSCSSKVLVERVNEVALEMAVISIVEVDTNHAELIHIDSHQRRDASVEIIANPAAFEFWLHLECDSDDNELTDRILDFLKRAMGSFWRVAPSHDYFDSALRSANRARGDFAVKFSVIPKANENVALSMSTYLSKSLRNAKLALDVAKLRADQESLHHLRVILRSTRAILEPVVKTFNSSSLEDLLSNVKSIAQATNSARDIDVIVTYFGETSPYNPFLHKLKERQSQINETLERELEERFVALESIWQASIAKLIAASSGTFKGPDGKLEIASTQTKKFVEKTISMAKSDCQITVSEIAKKNDPSSQELHDLRKDFKRLRYLSETFASDNTATTNTDIFLSKVLQTELGLFQDATVRMEFLEQEKEGLEDSNDLAPLMSLINQAQTSLQETKASSVLALVELSGKPGWSHPSQISKTNKSKNSKRANTSKSLSTTSKKHGSKKL